MNPLTINFVFGQRIILADTTRAVIVGVHPPYEPVIRSGEYAEHERERYDVTTYSVSWVDAINVVVTLTYDAVALYAHGNVPGVDRWIPLSDEPARDRKIDVAKIGKRLASDWLAKSANDFVKCQNCDANIVHVDDGTLDTVFECRECHAQARFNYDPAPDWSYDDFFRECHTDFANSHVCGEPD